MIRGCSLLLCIVSLLVSTTYGKLSERKRWKVEAKAECLHVRCILQSGPELHKQTPGYLRRHSCALSELVKANG